MKKLCIQFAVSFISVLALAAVFAAIVDPCYHYHKPFFGIKMNHQVYQTPGAAEHFSYDGAIVGSSMTENFRSSWFAEDGLRNVKLSYSGAGTLDLAEIMKKVFASGNTVRYIWTDLNDYQLTSDADSRFGEPPLYLYDGAGFDDVQYLFNSDVFWMAAAHLREYIAGTLPDADDAYTWEDAELFSAEKVLAENSWAMDRLHQGAAQQTGEDESGYYMRLCRENLDNFLPIIKEHPQTQFVFWFAPYSMLYWGRQVDEDRLWILDVYRESAQILLAFDNVRVFYFQDEKEIITDLNNYRDECHHSPRINRYIYDCIMAGRNELTVQNLQERFEGMRQFAASFDYDSLLKN